MRKLAVVVAFLAAAPAALAGGFPAGQCTEWAFKMRPEIVVDSMLRNASLQNWNAAHWAANAKAAGFRVGTTPAVGAIVVWQPHVDGAGAPGHVAYVEKVAKGSFYISEEDFDGSPAVHRRWVKTDGKEQFIYLQPGEHAPTAPLSLAGTLQALSATGSFAAGPASATDVQLQLDAPAIVGLKISGPNVDKSVSWTFQAGTWNIGLDKLAGAASLPAGTYTITAMPYSTTVYWRSVQIHLA